MRAVLVTGASGAAGPAVVRALVGAGYRVRTFSRHARPPQPGDEPIIGDLRDKDAVRSASRGMDVIVHMAAALHQSRPDAGVLQAYREVNVGGTENVVRAAVECGVPRVVHVSTIAVYGTSDNRPLTEASTPAPDSPYAESKLASERAALAATSRSGASITVVLRPAAIYGAGLKGNYLRLVRALSRGRFVQVGSARNCRALIFDEDFGRAVVAASEATDAAGRVYNVSDGERHALAEIIGAIAAALDRRPPSWHVPAAAALSAAAAVDALSAVIGRSSRLRSDLGKYLESVVIDSSRIQRELGWRPNCPLGDGWRLTIDRLRRAGVLA